MAKKKIKTEPDRVLIAGKPDKDRCDNKVVSAQYTPLNFFPIAILKQFRRFANVYFLVVGCIMFVGQYTTWFDTAISPWTTLGPLAVVISVSLLVEGFSDYKRHQNDHETNNAKCVILRRAEELEAEKADTKKKQPYPIERDEHICKGKDVAVDMNKMYAMDGSIKPPASSSNGESSSNGTKNNTVSVAFQILRRKDIRQGHFVLIKNREMVPADVVLLASSNDQGGAYIETSSIDGETNLKLRNSPHLPAEVLQALREGNPIESVTEQVVQESAPSDKKLLETIDAATKRVTRFSYLGLPDAASVLTNPKLKEMHGQQLQQQNGNGSADVVVDVVDDEESWGGDKSGMLKIGKRMKERNAERRRASREEAATAAAASGKYVAALTTEPPNASVHTFSGKLTLPPLTKDGTCYEVPLGAENVLLRGAVIRNTEWVIGLAFFTGTDTKLVQNSFETPSKFSELDKLINWTVLAILVVMILCIVYLSSLAVSVNEDAFDTLFYAGFNEDTSEPWPYFTNTTLEGEVPEWDTATTNWIQFFLLYVTLLNNFIPLSLYVSVEMVQFFMLYLVYVDLEMYDDTTDTRAVASSTIVSDLGRIEYIFSDKTGTLTQNVMRFKRCSVDGMIFGAPILRTRPGATSESDIVSAFHPLRQLLVGRFRRPSDAAGLQGLGAYSEEEVEKETSEADSKLTLNAEMFLRVMSLCHTVVVEKDIDKKPDISGAVSMASSHGAKKSVGSYAKSLFSRGRTSTADSLQSPVATSTEDVKVDTAALASPIRTRANTATSFAPGEDKSTAKSADGSPFGYAYQAESPDEGALVSAASSIYSFQVVGRDSSGIKLRCAFPSHLQDERLTQGLQSKSIKLEHLAAETAQVLPDGGAPTGMLGNALASMPAGDLREETWTILAVNKFDSDRKRMSILLRSPPELGNLPILFCKGADSSMLDPEICQCMGTLDSSLSRISEEGDGEDDMASMLRMQVHLGEFAKEGLRTLVLGMRVLTEQECTEWLEIYKSAAVSLKDREKLLTEAAMKVEKDLHIVGATAIEDKLQKNVPQTISTLEKAGIKLWVLTGDKRETAVEIGYSTHVLTSKMHLTEVPDNGKQHVRTQMAMEFIRLIKIGRLREYQKSTLDGKGEQLKLKEKLRRALTVFLFNFGKCRRSATRSVMRVMAAFMRLFGMEEAAESKLERVIELKVAERKILLDVQRRRNVRARAEKTIKGWLASSEGLQHKADSESGDESDELVLASSELEPQVFVRAKSARGVLQDMANSGDLAQPELRQLSIAHLTAHQAIASERPDEKPLVEEDMLSLESFVPGGLGDKAAYDKKKRTLLEKMFAVDKTVRKGRLKKHMTKEKLRAIAEGQDVSESTKTGDIANNRNVSRALVIEGAALKHLLGDPEFEEILFAVASNCDAVIACRVSPRQKALLVSLVRQNVHPEPVTLAIGDGANDVGMIQEAHVGVGISGKEGKQAVNASDFAIAQFRFLETLILIHGRWDFFRLSTVTLFSFYKNALMAGLIIVYTERTLYSGTPIFDQWVIAMLNFVAAWPIIFTGFFDRVLSKDYVRKHPDTYNATRENQLITVRSLFRWILTCFGHVFLIYYFTVPQQSYGGGITPAFLGLMRNNDPDAPGDGEGGDLKSVGTVTFSCMIFLLAIKVLYETRSLVHGKWPFCTCKEGVGEGFPSRLAYTWIGITFISVLFYLFALSTYQLVGRKGANQFSDFTLTANHVLATRSMSWMLMLFVPIMGMMVDVVFKVFANMFFPTQTQIHMELEAREKMLKRRQSNARRFRVRGHSNGEEP